MQSAAAQKERLAWRRWASAVVVALASAGISLPEAGAREYEQTFVVSSEEDIHELERLAEIEPETADLLLALFNRPLDLNRADRDLLYALPGITYRLADAIIDARSRQGAFGEVDDLLRVEGVDDYVLSSVRPFVTVTSVEGAAAAVRSPFGVGGEARLGTLWRRGFGRDQRVVEEQSRAPQAYLRVRGTGFTHFGAGGLLTYRTRTSTFWDHSRGQLMSNGPEEEADVDSLYVFGGHGPWAFIAGSYAVGFAERLTFDNTTLPQPHGWYEIDKYDEDRETGRVKPREGLFGTAVSLLGADVPGGWLDATAFVSTTQRDLYQYDYWYGLDPWHDDSGTPGQGERGACSTNGDCPAGYTCGDDNRCHSSRIGDASVPDQSLRYVTLKDAFRETLAGGNVTWSFDERSHLSVTAYQAMTSFLVAGDAEPSFAWHARYPRRPRFGAVGVGGRVGFGHVDLSAELSLTDRGAGAFLARAIAEPTPWAELSLAARWYGADYDNPFSRAQAAADESMGIRARNERGLRLRAVLKPRTRLRLVSDIDLWENPAQPAYDANHQLVWVSATQPPRDLRASQRVSYGVTSREEVRALVQYANNDLARNGWGQIYASGGWDYDSALATDAWAQYATVGTATGSGERRKVQLAVVTKRIPGVRLLGSVDWAWEDVGRNRNEHAHRFDLERRARLRASVRPWGGCLMVSNVTYWIHQVDREGASYYYDRERPALDAYLDVKQRLSGRFWLRARYGVLHYREERPDRFANYHLARLALEARL